MANLVLLRHPQSQWNLENRFTGWVDVPLSEKGIEQIREIARKLSKIKFDIVYTSPLVRNQGTVLRIFDYWGEKYPIFFHFQGKMKKWANFKETNKNYIPVFVTEKLNERYYGQLQGMNKDVLAKKYGRETIQVWRRSFEQGPPGGERLKDVLKRIVPFYKRYIVKDLKRGKNVLIVASHNSLRGLAKYLGKISDKEIADFEIATGALIKYEFDKNLNIKNKKAL